MLIISLTLATTSATLTLEVFRFKAFLLVTWIIASQATSSRITFISVDNNSGFKIKVI